MPCQSAQLAPVLSEDSTPYYTIYEFPSPWPVINTNILTTGTLEHDGLPDAVIAPSCLELERGRPHSSALFEQSSLFPRDSDKATDHDLSLETLSVSGCTSCDDWTQGTTAQFTGSKGSCSAPIALVAAIEYPELVPPQCDPLDIAAVKTGVDHSSVPLSQEPERPSEPRDSDNSTPPPAIEGACDVNNVHEAFLSNDPEGDDDGETFDYKGVDWEPRASGVPTPSPASSLEPHFEHPHTPSKTDHDSTSSSLSTSSLKESALQASTMYASDDIQVGLKCKNEAKTAYNTRRRIKCASADDLRVMVELVQATRVPDSGPVTPLHDIGDKCISINQVALLGEDLPVFTQEASATSEEVTSFTGPPQPVFVGLKASIHAPRNDELLRTQTQECAGTLDSMHTINQASSLPVVSQTRPNSPKLVSAIDGIQESTRSAPTPCPQGLAYPTVAKSSASQTSGLELSTLSPTEADAGGIQTPNEPAEISVPPTAQATIGSNAPRGLAASMHAPQECLPVQAKREILGHSADAPNWAAAAREDSTAAASRGSSSAQRGKTPDNELDDSDELDVSMATRCAIQDDENEGSGVDDSDGSMHPAADDRDGAAGSYETDSGLDAADDSNEQESTTWSRRSRRRGKPRRSRTKVPYLPPPRMRNLTQHPIADMLIEARALHGLTTGPAVSNGQHYSHALPQQSLHPASGSGSGSIVPPQAMGSDPLGQPLGYHQTQQQHMGSSSTANFHPSHISSLQSFTSPAPYYPILYPQNPHGERATPLMPCPLPYGR
ncbi:hypothetical protein BJY52DRAFT_247013 [Lactarius psammicola]|nr:hypothetical protein BJY52DRAFT_247013 [Lactarius psammicola]